MAEFVERVVITSGSFPSMEPSICFWMSRARQVVRTTLDIQKQIDVERGMNDPEVIMLDALPDNDLTVYRKAIEAAGEAISLVRRLPAPLKSLADQVIRSASSVPANLAEGHGRSGRDRLYHWRIAYGSAKEVDGHLRLLVRARAVNSRRAAATIRLFDEVRAMTWRLLHPRP